MIVKNIPQANYTFAPGGAGVGTITFLAPYDTIELGCINLITNEATGDIIYQFQKVGKLATGGTIVASVLTLDYDTTAMGSGDVLNFSLSGFDDGVPTPISGTFTLPTGASTEAKQDSQITQETALNTVTGTIADAAIDTDTTGTVSGKLRGLVKLIVNLLSRWPATLGAGGGLKVDGSGTALPVTVTGVSTSANQVSEIALLTTIDGDTSNLDVALSTRLKPADTLAGVTTVGAVTAITNALPAGNNNIGDVDVTSLPALVAGSAIIGKVGIDQTTPGTTNLVALTAETTKVIGVVRNSDGAGNLLTSNSTTPTAKFSLDQNITSLLGTAIDVNSGNKSAGTQRMVVATDQPNLTTPLNVTIQSAATGGDTTFHLVSAATTNATNIKASAGKVTGWFIYNSNAAARKLVFHNTAGTPTAGASVFFAIVIPATSGANVSFPDGIDFSTGIGITTVTGLADSDSAAVALNDLIINIFYK